MEQQLLPYAVVSFFEKDPKFASLACQGNQQEIDSRLERILEAKRKNGGIVLSDGKIELRFPNRAMAESIHLKLISDDTYSNLSWFVT